MRRLLLVAFALGCGPQTTHERVVTLPTSPPESETIVRERLISELTEDVLASYDRDEPPEVVTDMVRAEVGGARIGFGPDDLALGEELVKPGVSHGLWRRDPPPVGNGNQLYLASGGDLRSKDLHVVLAADRSAAWVSDELSWRIPACDRTAVIPMRSTELYAHDGDRWILVFQHVSFAQPPQPQPSGAPRRRIKQAVVRDIADPLSAVLQQALGGRSDSAIASDAHLIGPGMTDEWFGKDILHAQVGGGAVRAQDRRIGTIGRTVGKATVAYWVGEFDVDTAVGRVPLRGTFVFEKRSGAWQLVQGHLSQPISDDELAARVFGTAIVSLAPLRLSCGA
jgi:hypothetical protein